MGIAEDLDNEVLQDEELPLTKEKEDFRYHISASDYSSTIKLYESEEDYSNIAFLEGSKCTVDYFNQDLDKNDSGSTLDAAMPTVLTPRTKIKNMVLIVTESLGGNKYEDMQGSAIFYAGSIRPRVGDIFIMPILNRKLGIFEIKQVSLKTYVNKDMFVINYSVYLIDDSRETNAYLYSLEQSVNRTFVYNPDFMRNRSSVLFTEEEDNRYKKTLEHMDYISGKWIKEFRDYRTNLLAFRNNGLTYVDFALESFFISILNPRALEKNPIYANTTYAPFGNRLTRDTVLDVFKDKKMIDLSDVSKHAIGLRGLGVIDFDLRGGDLSALGFDCMVFVYKDNAMLSQIAMADACFRAVDLLPEASEYKNVLLPDIAELFKTSKYYMFSENFYNKDRTNISAIEELLLDYLEDKEMDLVKLNDLMESVNKWSNIEKFYYIPILYLLQRYYVDFAYSFISRNF